MRMGKYFKDYNKSEQLVNMYGNENFKYIFAY